MEMRGEHLTFFINSRWGRGGIKYESVLVQDLEYTCTMPAVVDSWMAVWACSHRDELLVVCGQFASRTFHTHARTHAKRTCTML